MFADDLKLIANSSDKTVVDSDLKSLEEWERNSETGYLNSTPVNVRLCIWNLMTMNIWSIP